MNKIGIGILTNKRKQEFTNLLNSLPSSLDIYVVYLSSNYNIKTNKIKESYTFNRESCPSWSKNQLLRMMINDNCKHLFLLEDNIEITNNNIFDKYLEAAKKSGIYSLSFKEDSNTYNSIEYDNISISFAKNLKKSFVYMPTGFIKSIGFYDERYDKGLLEHTDLVYRFYQKKVTPPFGWFADLENSNEYIKLLTHLNEDKTTESYKQNYWYECNWFKHKFGKFHFQEKLPDDEVILKEIEKLKNIYGTPL